MPDEKAVCQRLASIRRAVGLNQEELASAIGLTRDQLTNIETGRTELGFIDGWNACKRLGIRQLYLATGSQPMTPFEPFNLDDPDVSIPKTSFRRALTTGPFADLLITFEAWRANIPPGASLAAYEDAIKKLARTFLLRIPDHFYPLLLDCVYKTLQAFEARCSDFKKGELLKDFPVDSVTVCGNSSGVQKTELTLDGLLSRLQAATSQSGKKTELADRLGVPLSNVSMWLSGKREPSGRTTLELLNWVEQQERATLKEESPGSATNTSKGESTLRKGKHSETFQSKSR